MTTKAAVPLGLAKIAGARDYILTAEFGLVIGRNGQTIRKNLCLTGEAYGVRPRKIGGRLLWPVADIARILEAAR